MVTLLAAFHWWENISAPFVICLAISGNSPLLYSIMSNMKLDQQSFFIKAIAGLIP
ncbi:hypothetical protein C1646_727506 [Rhizophagus diaphanus]|nr:hypothetical protein C1646_727506 [Rhizophagus diaphanus] [Rhizophagus sp. MUCL 43196]